METVTPALDFGCAPIFGVYDGSKRVWYDTPRPERYHLDSDPKQLVNRYRPEHASEAQAIFDRFPRKWPPTDDPMALSPEDREAMEALGYITRSVARRRTAPSTPRTWLISSTCSPIRPMSRRCARRPSQYDDRETREGAGIDALQGRPTRRTRPTRGRTPDREGRGDGAPLRSRPQR